MPLLNNSLKLPPCLSHSSCHRIALMCCLFPYPPTRTISKGISSLLCFPEGIHSPRSLFLGPEVCIIQIKHHTPWKCPISGISGEHKPVLWHFQGYPKSLGYKILLHGSVLHQSGMTSQSWSRQKTQLCGFEAQQALKAQIMDCMEGAGYSSEDGWKWCGGVLSYAQINETSELIFTVAAWENKASYWRDKAGSILLPAPCQANTHPHTGSGIRRGCFQSLFPHCIEQFPSSASSSSPTAIKPANKESLGAAVTARRDLPPNPKKIY